MPILTVAGLAFISAGFVLAAATITRPRWPRRARPTTGRHARGRSLR